MDRQERKHEPRKTSSRKEAEDIQADPEVVETGKKLKEEIDNLVDEIDEILEQNASEFVKNYVQKGGQ
jgi:ubiquitin-like protein Pup